MTLIFSRWQLTILLNIPQVQPVCVQQKHRQNNTTFPLLQVTILIPPSTGGLDFSPSTEMAPASLLHKEVTPEWSCWIFLQEISN